MKRDIICHLCFIENVQNEVTLSISQYEFNQGFISLFKWSVGVVCFWRAVYHAWVPPLPLLSICKRWSHGPEPANLLSQPHLSWIICWLTPDTFMSLTHRLPTIALPNGLRPPILQVPIVDQLNSVQEQTLPNWPHMFSQSSDPPAGNIYGSLPKSLKCRLHACIGSAIKDTKMVLIRRQQVKIKAALFLRPKKNILDE